MIHEPRRRFTPRSDRLNEIGSGNADVPPILPPGRSARLSQETLVFENLELRPGECQALVDGRRIALTVREFQVLMALAERAGQVVDRPHIYRLVWGGEMKRRERSVDVFVRKVRIKLAAASPGWVYIHTHFGFGYRLTPEARIERDSLQR